jgi:REP element-mobilizing transposase RayT
VPTWFAIVASLHHSVPKTYREQRIVEGTPLEAEPCMARRRRIQYPGAVYHVMARGNRKARIFEDEDDCRSFLDLLARTTTRYGFRVYAACLMVNHYHIVGETPRGNVAHAMRYLNGIYAQASNRRHRRTGHVFEARYRSLNIQRESYLKRAVRYVVLNPVRAHLVTAAAAWPWTTYRATAGLEPAPAWLSLDWLEWAFRAESRPEAAARYREYVETTVSRAGVNTRAIALGGRASRELMANLSRGPEVERGLPGPKTAIARPLLTAALADTTGPAATRRRAIYQAHAIHGYSQSDIARYLKVDPSTISKLLHRLERAGRHE